MRLALLATISLIAFAPVVAANDGIIALPPAGHTIVNLSVNEDVKLAQDTLSASLRYELDGASANEIQDKINKAIADAVADSKVYPDVKTTTGSYYVYAYDEQQIIDPRTGKPMPSTKKWRATQTIELESQNSTKLLEFAGKIQTKGFVMNGLNYSLSQKKSESVQDDLMKKALASLNAKAKIAATALGKSSYDIIDVNINGSAPPVYPVYARASMMKMEAASADMVAAPVAEAGEASVTMNVTARVLLKP
jgi:predicted secreted protein